MECHSAEVLNITVSDSMLPYGSISMTSLVYENGKQCIQCFANFSLTIQTEILSLETSCFLKEIVFLKLFTVQPPYNSQPWESKKVAVVGR